MSDEKVIPKPTFRQVAAHVYGFDGGDGGRISAFVYTFGIATMVFTWFMSLAQNDLTMEWSMCVTIIGVLFSLLLTWQFRCARLCLQGLCPICEEVKHEWRH